MPLERKKHFLRFSFSVHFLWLCLQVLLCIFFYDSSQICWIPIRLTTGNASIGWSFLSSRPHIVRVCDCGGVFICLSLSEARVGFSLLIAAFNSITDLACVGWVWSYVYFIMIGSGTVNLLLLAFLLIVLDRFDLMVSIDRAWLFVSLAFCSLLVSAADLRSELSLAKDKMKMKMSFIVTYFIASLACPAFWLIL